MKKKRKKGINKKIDLLIVSCLLIITAFLWWFFDLRALIGGLLYTLIPSFYMIWKEKKNFRKIIPATFIFGFLLGGIYDFIQVFNKSWIVDTIIPWKILGVVPIDNIIGYGLMTFLIVIFYEHFIDTEKNREISKNFSKGVLIFSAFIMAILIIFLLDPFSLKIPYPYFILSLIAIIFPIIFTLQNPRMLPKFFKIASFFFFVWFIAEIVALKTNGWTFPGQYIGLVTIFGVTFPFEEFFFWMFWYAASIIAYYEFFIDDQK